jgi:RNA-splicing ligase RtcB
VANDVGVTKSKETVRGSLLIDGMLKVPVIVHKTGNPLGLGSAKRALKRTVELLKGTWISYCHGLHRSNQGKKKKKKKKEDFFHRRGAKGKMRGNEKKSEIRN